MIYPRFSFPEFVPGDPVIITRGAFESFVGEVLAIDDEHGKRTIGITIFGRQTPVEVERWEIDRKGD